MKKAILFLSLFLIFQTGFGQSIRLSVQKPDSKIISTGALYERIKLPPKYFFDFGINSNKSIHKPAQWMALYHSIYQADFKHRLSYFLDLKRKVKKDLKNNVYHIGVLHYQYNKIKAKAWQNKQVTAQPGILIIKDKSAIETKQIFAVSPIMTKKNTGLDIIFDFSKTDYFSNIQDDISYYLINFDDGNNTQKILPDTQKHIHYNTYGTKHIKVEAVTAKGVHLQAGFDFRLHQIAMPAPDETWNNYTADIPYNGSSAVGEVAVFFGVGNTDFTRPVIISDGFDPGDIRDLSEIYDIVNQQNMVNELRNQGYDLILLNFQGGDDYIQRNAMLLVKLIQDINTRMQAAGTMKPANQIAVIGPSMSGLVSRYALDYMEQHNIPHNVRNWIAFDSPMKGANVPLGVQHWLRFYAETADVSGAQDALQSLKGPAAKQMLNYYYTATSGHTAGHHSLYTSFYNEINNMGFPQQTRIVAIANGSGYGNGQVYSPGQQIIEYKYRSWLVDLDGDVWAVPNHQDTRIFYGVYDEWGFWAYEEENVYVNNTNPYDSGAGGTRDTFQELADTDTGGYGDIIAYYPSHAFIPSISSMCIQNTNDPYYNINAHINNLQTPFDKLYYPNTNQPHIAITNESLQWFKHEIINYAPQFTSTPVTEVDEGSVYTYTFTATDQNEWNTINYSAVNLPAWLSYDAQTHTISGTPSYEDIGTHNIILKIDDGLDETQQSFSIEVFPKCSHAPVTEWNGNTWSNGLPDVSRFVVLNQNYNTLQNGNIKACSLQINQGKILNIEQDHPVVVERNVENNGEIIVKNKASFVQTSDKAEISGNGIFRLEKTVDNLTHYYNMVYWSSPINSNSFTFNDLLPNAWRYYSFNPNTQSWVFETGSSNLQTGLGYVVSAPTGHTGGDINVSFQKNNAPFNNADIDVPVVVNGAGATDDDDWNLLGNPYPSAIDFNQFAQDNPNIQGSYYAWTNCAGLNGHNQQASGYSIYSLGGSTTACQGNGFTATRYIASGQGFAIEANAAGIVQFKNSQRVSTNNDNFASRTGQTDRLWLDITDSANHFQQILVGFRDDATTQIDRLYDAKAMDAGNGLSFYSMAENQKLAIQFLPALDQNDQTIPLGFNLQNNNPDNLTIHLNHFEGELDHKNIYLIDGQTVINLKQQDYTLSATQGTYNNPFFLLITGQTLSLNDSKDLDKNIKIYQQDNQLIITSLNQSPIGQIRLIDAAGRLVFAKNNITKAIYYIDISHFKHQFTICLINNNQGIINKKIIIR